MSPPAPEAIWRVPLHALAVTESSNAVNAQEWAAHSFWNMRTREVSVEEVGQPRSKFADLLAVSA